jgi:hypothetical protein
MQVEISKEGGHAGRHAGRHTTQGELSERASEAKQVRVVCHGVFAAPAPTPPATAAAAAAAPPAVPASVTAPPPHGAAKFLSVVGGSRYVFARASVIAIEN